MPFDFGPMLNCNLGSSVKCNQVVKKIPQELLASLAIFQNHNSVLPAPQKFDAC